MRQYIHLSILSICLFEVTGSGCGLVHRLSNRDLTVNRALRSKATVKPDEGSRPSATIEHSEYELVSYQTPTDKPLVATAEVLLLSQLISDVQTMNPSVQAKYAAWQAALNKNAQVTSLEDPMFATTMAPSSFNSNTVESAYVLEASQKFSLFGKRSARGSIANADASIASYDVVTIQQKLAEVTELAYLDYYYARRQLELNKQNTAILKSLRENAATRYQNGLVTQQDVFQASIEQSNLEQRRIETERMERVAIGRINTLLRRSPTEPLPLPPESLEATLDLPDQESLLALATEHRPEIFAAAASIKSEEAKLLLAQRQFYSDAEVFGRYDSFWQPRATQSELREQVGVRINVPIYRQRVQAAMCEATQRVAMARSQYDSMILDVQTEVQSAYELVQESRRSLEVIDAKLIPNSEQNVAVASSSYDTSKISFTELAIAQRQFIEARERKLQAQVELHRRVASLQRIVGGGLDRSNTNY